ncbi:hypothetical protein [Dryocola sp. BD626]|uniref:hypothetical protein n=1 Tax=Dryocola sp. BD626 TaxID=3133273 RepID=UPI003F4FDE11
MPRQPMPVIGTHKETGDTVYFRSAYYAPGFKRAGIKEAISGRAKSHRGFTWRYATKLERDKFAQH